MSVCEQCGVDVPTMEQVTKVRFGEVHYFCSEAHAQASLEKPAQLAPLERVAAGQDSPAVVLEEAYSKRQLLEMAKAEGIKADQSMNKMALSELILAAREAAG